MIAMRDKQRRRKLTSGRDGQAHKLVERNFAVIKRVAILHHSAGVAGYLQCRTTNGCDHETPCFGFGTKENLSCNADAEDCCISRVVREGREVAEMGESEIAG